MLEATANLGKGPNAFFRFEFKYLLNRKKRLALEKDLALYLKYDQYTEGSVNHKYFVRSIYFDDPRYSAFHDRIDGLHTRHRFRVRTYTDIDNGLTPIFLEKKGRHNNFVYKKRVPINRAEADFSELKSDSLLEAIYAHAEESATLYEFRYDAYRKKLGPIAVIDYQRTAYVSKYNPGFRLTLDDDLMVTEDSALFSKKLGRAIRSTAGYSIVEVKFEQSFPAWFHRLIQIHELSRLSISKIAIGMESLGLAYDEQ